MQEYELKNCPCCDGQPITLVERVMGSIIVRIECCSCHLSTPQVMESGGIAESRRAAGTIWNRRPWDGLNELS